MDPWNLRGNESALRLSYNIRKNWDAQSAARCVCPNGTWNGTIRLNSYGVTVSALQTDGHRLLNSFPYFPQKGGGKIHLLIKLSSCLRINVGVSIFQYFYNLGLSERGPCPIHGAIPHRNISDQQEAGLLLQGNIQSVASSNTDIKQFWNIFYSWCPPLNINWIPEQIN